MNTQDAPQLESPADGPARGIDQDADLMEIMRAYNELTDRLHRSHEVLTEEVQRLQGELASANAALQRSRRLAALGEMAAGIAHEVRNPLASIQLYAEMLSQDLAGQDDQLDLVRRISVAVRGLDAIVNDVLIFSRDMQVRPSLITAADLFARAGQTIAPVVEDDGVAIEPSPRSNEIELPCDTELMHQAMVNLMRNAVDAMEGEGVIRLDATVGDGRVQLTIADTGPGISDEAIDRIFNPFFTTRATGTGLGLAIVHRIIDAHGGSISVHNDGGAVFTLTLPADSADSAADAEDGAAGPMTSPRRTTDAA